MLNHEYEIEYGLVELILGLLGELLFGDSNWWLHHSFHGH